MLNCRHDAGDVAFGFVQAIRSSLVEAGWSGVVECSRPLSARMQCPPLAMALYNTSEAAGYVVLLDMVIESQAGFGGGVTSTPCTFFRVAYSSLCGASIRPVEYRCWSTARAASGESGHAQDRNVFGKRIMGGQVGMMRACPPVGYGCTEMPHPVWFRLAAGSALSTGDARRSCSQLST